MVSRRSLLLGAATLAAPPKMDSKERIDRALRGEDVDRTPFTYWIHFRLAKFPGERHAQATLEFHRKFRTDLVKVMSDFPYPRPEGRWDTGLKLQANPFPEQIRALEIIRDALAGRAYFVETIFNPWNQAEKVAGKAEVQRLKQEQPQALLDALEVIAKSEANHARKAIQTGAAGIFLAIANAGNGVLSPEEYARFGEPFDRIVLEAVKDAPLNILHLHGDHIPLERFYRGWPVAAISYSHITTGVPIAEFRKQYGGVLLAGIDELGYAAAPEADLQQQWAAARKTAGGKLILAPGCSLQDSSTDEELLKLPRVLGAA